MTYEQRIRQELERVLGTDEWICVHCSSEDPSAFEVGTVGRLTSEHLLLHSVDSKGRDNGTRSVPVEEVLGITLGGSYLEALRVLREALPPPCYLDADDPSPEAILRSAQAEGLAVNVRMREETIGGFVREIGEGWVAIADVDADDGGHQGVRIVSLKELERVFVGGEDEMRLTTLARARGLRDAIG